VQLVAKKEKNRAGSSDGGGGIAMVVVAAHAGVTGNWSFSFLCFVPS